MKTFSRRDMLKTSLLAPAAVAAVHGMGPISSAMEAPKYEAEPMPSRSCVTRRVMP